MMILCGGWLFFFFSFGEKGREEVVPADYHVWNADI